ncbi:MAG TPA: D-amino-acid transaminase [Longimicrobiaceae bacterium]
MPRIYLNGSFLEREEARLPIGDRGFFFADGIYEVTRVIRGRLFEEDAHWSRLAQGARDISLAIEGHLDRDRLREISRRLIEENDLGRSEATVYLQITRGAAPRTHWFPPAGTPPTVFASAAPFEIPRELRSRGAPAITHPDIRWARCDIKSVNLLPNVLAKQRAHEVGAFEAVLIRDGAVTEGASANIFGVIDGRVRTYPLSNLILPGVTRRVILELARELGIGVEERPIYAEELPLLQELFATGTTTDVQPLVSLDGRPVGDGHPGPIATALREALEKRMGVA